MRKGIREIVVASAAKQNLTAYAIGKRAGLTPETVKRFFDGQSVLSSENLEKICGVLGLELRPEKLSKKSKISD